MNPSIRFLLLLVFVLLMVFSSAQAGDITLPNTFQSGSPAVAAEVNANFSAVETAVDDNDSRIASLEAALAALQVTVADQADTIASQAGTIDTLQARLAAVETNEVMALDSYLTVDEVSDSRGPLVTFAGVNLQIVNGIDNTSARNGLGNLIIGYDEVRINGDAICSSSTYTDQGGCVEAGHTWAVSHKTGSHYLVLGMANNYSQSGGIVAGYENTANGVQSSVIGGRGNVASGYASTVAGGIRNIASGADSCVIGGYENTASGNMSSATGGRGNIASAYTSSISGGSGNTTGGNYSSISGGSNNTASGALSSVSGGDSVEAEGDYDWRAGDLFQDH